MGRNERVFTGGRELDRIAANLGYPPKLQMDNVPELVSLTLAQGGSLCLGPTKSIELFVGPIDGPKGFGFN